MLGLVLMVLGFAGCLDSATSPTKVSVGEEFTLRRGESVSIVLSSADAEHCFAIDALRIEKRIVPGRTTTFDLAPDRAGVFAFYCCLESGDAAAVERGQLTVTE